MSGGGGLFGPAETEQHRELPRVTEFSKSSPLHVKFPHVYHLTDWLLRHLLHVTSATGANLHRQ